MSHASVPTAGAPFRRRGAPDSAALILGVEFGRAEGAADSGPWPLADADIPNRLAVA
jgi:hypothetical protein